MAAFTVTDMQSLWNPWHELGRRKHLKVRWVERGRRGCIDYDECVITLRKSMSYEERRSVVSHELVHDERGPVPLWLEPREETAVRAESARRLISIEALCAVLAWTGFIQEAADDLGVDVPTLQARLSHLTDDERTTISCTLEGVPHVGQSEEEGTDGLG